MDKEFKEKVAKFMRFFVGKLIKKSEELSQNDIPPVCYFDERTDNLAVDYGAFLNYLTEWIAEENRIKKEDVSNYIYYYFGLVYNKKYNFLAAALIKLFFAGHYFVFKVYNSKELTDYLTYPVFLTSDSAKIYKLNCLFIHQNYLERTFDFNELDNFKNRLNNRNYVIIKDQKIYSKKSIYKVFKDTKLDTFN